MPDWNTEVLPVLEAVHVAIQRDSAGGTAMVFASDGDTINDVLGREANDKRTAAVLLELRSAGFITCEATMGGGVHLSQLTEKGSQYVAGWPTAPGADVQDRLIAALDRYIPDASSAAERSRLEKLRDGVAGVGRDVLTDVLAKIATSHIGD